MRKCGETMKLIAFITDMSSIQKILSHIGEQNDPPTMHPARDPPEECHESEYQYDQTISW